MFLLQAKTSHILQCSWGKKYIQPVEAECCLTSWRFSYHLSQPPAGVQRDLLSLDFCWASWGHVDAGSIPGRLHTHYGVISVWEEKPGWVWGTGIRKLPDCSSSSWQENVILRFRTGYVEDFKAQYILYWAGERGREDSCFKETSWDTVAGEWLTLKEELGAARARDGWGIWKKAMLESIETTTYACSALYHQLIQTHPISQCPLSL